MTDAPLPDLVLFGRPDCSLCDETRDLLHALLDERVRLGHAVPTFVELDIETDPALVREYATSIPVGERGARRLELATSPTRLKRLLGDVLDGEPARA